MALFRRLRRMSSPNQQRGGRRGYTAAALTLTMLPPALALTTMASADAGIYSDRVDLVFLMDGSGSIDSYDWQLQKQGYTAALADDITFPRDGSVSVSLIQWSYTGGSLNTRVEVPLTIIDDEGDVDTLTQRISNISQINGSTNPGDAIRAGTDLLLASGREDADWSLCMSTDGSINAGLNMSSAVSYAQSNYVDRYGVVAIEDGYFDEADARAAYEPYTFGGGTVVVARSTAEFATLITGCMNPALRVRALEVNQGVQDWNNSVELVEGRDTIVRAFLETYNGEPEIRTSGRLRGYRNGVELPLSPLAPLNNDQAITATPDAVANRSDRDSSLNFDLPLLWAQGTIELRLELPGGSRCAWPDNPIWNVNCGQEITFTPSRAALNNHMIGLYWDGMEPGRTKPTWDDATYQALRSEAMYPVPGVDPVMSDLQLDSDWYQDGLLPGWCDTPLAGCLAGPLAAIQWHKEWTINDDYSDYFQGMIPGEDEGIIPDGGSIGYASGAASVGFIGYAPGLTDGHNQRNLLPHELGHSVGLDHTVSEVGLATNTGVCDEAAPRGSYLVQPHYIGDDQYYTLGPIGVPETEIWGADSTTFSLNEDLAVSAPQEVFALMSYCDTLNPSSQGHWISEWDWRKARGGNLSASFAAESSAPGLLVSGFYDGTSGTAGLNQVLPVPAADAGDSTSTVQVRAVAADGSVLASGYGSGEGTTGFDSDGRPGAVVNVELPVDAAKVATLEMIVDGQKVGSWAASGSAPVVRDVRATVRDGAVDLTWTASDADGDAVRSSVLYSTDDGASWTPAAVGLAATSATFPNGTLPGGRLLLKVITSDGIRYAQTQGTATVANNAPDVTVLSPGADQHFAAAQPVTFRASVFDAEDGLLPASSVVWSSDRDGQLGTGERFTKRADQLSEGWHTVTVTATDSMGTQTAQTRRIFVSRVPNVTPPSQAVYGWGGFAPPVEEAGITDVNAGRTVPIKFTINGETGDDSGVVRAAFVRDGATYALVRDRAGEYHVNATVPQAWAGSTGTFEVELTDGQRFTAQFTFR